tara:strand:- start:340 stop:627 length:288 start_codon:yes stop_codon:yes gene_type:complete
MLDEKKVTAAQEMLQTLLTTESSPLEIIEIMACFNGMVSCGIAFSVKGDSSFRRKSYQIQQELAKATRKSIEMQKDNDFPKLCFEPMFAKIKESN